MRLGLRVVTLVPHASVPDSFGLFRCILICRTLSLTKSPPGTRIALERTETYFLGAPMTQNLVPVTQDLAQETWRWQDKTAKLSLKFSDDVLREVALSVGVVTIGRQPDNLLQIDNPAVSGHHAKVYWEGDHYVLEDTESFNGTYINNRRISKVVLQDGDVVLIGKHTIAFHAQGGENVSAQHQTADRSMFLQHQLDKARPRQLDLTVVLDTRSAEKMRAQAAAAASAAGATGLQMHGIGANPSAADAEIAGRRRI